MLRLGLRALCLSLLLLSSSAWAIPVLLWDLIGVRDPETRTEKLEDALRELSRPDGLRVFWWNVEGGSTSRRIHEGGCPVYQVREPLERNIVTMAHSNLQPDIIVLGEYSPDTLAPWARRELDQIYRHRFFIPYAPGAKDGIGGYSSMPLTVSTPERLPWEPGATPAERQASREVWLRAFPSEVRVDRPYVRLEGRWKGMPFSLVPQHFLNPWRVQMGERALGLPSWLARNPRLSKVCATALTVKDIFLDKGTPALVQAQELVLRLQRDFGPRMDAQPFLVIGDLNAPAQSSALRTLTRHLADAFGPLTRNFPSAQPTFPSSCAANGRGFAPLKIDHALASPGMNVQMSRVLRIHGSDHHPAYVVVSPR